MITRREPAGHERSAELAAAPSDWHASTPWVRFGNRVVLWMFGGLVAFSALVSISGAVVTAGSVNVEGNYQTVQHLDGGIVAKIHVKSGDRVKAGDLLIKLDETQARAALEVTRGRVREHLIQRARLEAERDGRNEFELPSGADTSDPEVARIAAAQKTLFEARREAQNGAQSVLRQRFDQLRSEASSLDFQLAAIKKQSDISAKELANVMPLFEKGYVNTQRIAPLQRESARLEGERGRITAELAKNQSAQSEIELRIAQSQKEYMQEVVDELRKVEAGLAEQEETLKAHADKVRRTEIRSPRDGFVHALTVHTEGGVVTAASPILQIIPEGQKLVIDAQLRPQDIDKVHAGQTAAVMFPAFNARATPRIAGKVIKVSPAEIVGKEGERHFTVQVQIPPEELDKLPSGHQLVPGMPAEVFIETSSRSILSYFLKPLTDTFTHALREG